jgi:hypothetical protein
MPLIRGHHYFDDHFTQTPNAWARDSRLTLRARGLLTLILSHSAGWSLSINSLAEQNQEGKDAIRKSIHELETVGYLARTQSKQDGRFSETIWTTQDPVTPLADLPLTENPTTENPTPKKNILKEEQVNKKLPQAELEDEFSEFWNRYPRKVEKLSAKKSFIKAAQDGNLEAILEGVKRLSLDPNLPPKQFIPHPATWLNSGGWENEPYPVRVKTKQELENDLLAYNAIRLEREAIQRDRERFRLATEKAEAEGNRAEGPPQCEHGQSIARCIICIRNNKPKGN